MLQFENDRTTTTPTSTITQYFTIGKWSTNKDIELNLYTNSAFQDATCYPKIVAIQPYIEFDKVIEKLDRNIFLSMLSLIPKANEICPELFLASIWWFTTIRHILASMCGILMALVVYVRWNVLLWFVSTNWWNRSIYWGG